MVYIDAWKLMLFLACPIMKGLNSLIWSGLFINELRSSSQFSWASTGLLSYCPDLQLYCTTKLVDELSWAIEIRVSDYWFYIMDS